MAWSLPRLSVRCFRGGDCHGCRTSVCFSASRARSQFARLQTCGNRLSKSSARYLLPFEAFRPSVASRVSRSSGRCGETSLCFRSRQPLFSSSQGVIYVPLRFRFVIIIRAQLQGFSLFSLSFVHRTIPTGSNPACTFLHARQVKPFNTYLAKIFQISKVQTFILPRSGFAFAQGSGSLSFKVQVRFRSRFWFAFAQGPGSLSFKACFRSRFKFPQGPSPKVDTYPPLLDNRP